MKKKLFELGLHGPGQYRVTKSLCLGRCSLGPLMVIYPQGIWYRYTTYTDIDEIITKHLLNDTIVARLLIDPQPL